MKTFAICCLGCKVNTYEAESLAAALKERGFQEVDFHEKAEVYCIFTCAVTNTAASKSRKKVHQAIRQNESALICAVGCYVQIKAEEMSQDARIDILVGSSGKNELPDLIVEGLKTRQRQMRIQDVRQQAEFENLPLDSFAHQTRAYLKIQDGCNQFCSYCIIPYARGKERSLPLQNALQQAARLAEHHAEIVLAGIHTGRYGKEEGVTLTELLEKMLETTSIQRIRISSIEITEISDALIDLMSNQPRIARHLHIPVQSGCDATLRRMNRPYSTRQYLERIQEIRKRIPDISISTDLIVGFPQESEEEFQCTRAFLFQAGFSFLHVFPFSSKSKTAASRMKPEVETAIKKQRVEECLAISNQLKLQYYSSFIGKAVDVLIEKTEGKESFGHTSEYIPILLKGDIHPGTMAHGIVTAADQDGCYGKEVPYEAE